MVVKSGRIDDVTGGLRLIGVRAIRQESHKTTIVQVSSPALTQTYLLGIVAVLYSDPLAVGMKHFQPRVKL